jgi:hypothetical protein
MMSNSEIATTDQSSVVSIIERVMLDPALDVDKMERILNMQERVMNKQSEMSFNTALSAVQKDAPAIQRKASNDQTRSRYALLEHINESLIPVYTEHGFSLSFDTGDAPDGLIRINCTVSHNAGHSRLYHYDLPLDNVGAKGNVNKTNVHASGSTISYGRRYLTCMIFNVVLTNEDIDGNKNKDLITNEDLYDWREYGVEAGKIWASIEAIKKGIATKEYSSVVEAMFELTNEERDIVLKAPSKGGILESTERSFFRSKEWQDAKSDFRAENEEGES